MMTHELEVSILAAPLAAMDRQALSQAWYSALHVAQRAPQQRADASQAARCAVSAPRSVLKCTPASADNNRLARTSVAAHAGRGSRNATPVDPVAERRAPSVLSRRIERRFAVAAQPVARATFSIGRGTARVHVIMQSNGCTARLVAICRPHMRDVVARALAEARIALAARGIAVAAMPSSSRSRRTTQCS